MSWKSYLQEAQIKVNAAFWSSAKPIEKKYIQDMATLNKGTWGDIKSRITSARKIVKDKIVKWEWRYIKTKNGTEYKWSGSELGQWIGADKPKWVKI